jgi:hypothetical protein
VAVTDLSRRVERREKAKFQDARRLERRSKLDGLYAVEQYRKTPFRSDPGPRGRARSDAKLAYVVRSIGRRPLTDFRLQWGVVKSWAIPKTVARPQSSANVPTEDHPLEVRVRGVIPEGSTAETVGSGTAGLDAESKAWTRRSNEGSSSVSRWGEAPAPGRDADAAPRRSSPSWLLIKHQDERASSRDVAEQAALGGVGPSHGGDRAGRGGNMEKAADGDRRRPAQDGGPGHQAAEEVAQKSVWHASRGIS